MNLRQLGEFGLIERLALLLPPVPPGVTGIGDDAAVLPAPSGSCRVLLTTDMLVEDVHFSFSFATWEQVGYKSLVVNVSDVAAMGGIPRAAVVSLAVPGDCSPANLERLYRGLARAAAEYSVTVVGGDVVSSRCGLVINIALYGEAVDRVVSRDGATPGDLVVVTGPMGLSAAGLAAGLAGLPSNLPAVARVLEAHLEPRAQVKVGQLAARLGATAMMDSSDGLSFSLYEICRQSGVGCRLYWDRIPQASEIYEVASMLQVSPREPEEWILHGGEDYELVMTVPAPFFPRLQEEAVRIGRPLYAIGEITPPEQGLQLVAADGSISPLPVKGYRHF